VDTLEPDLAEFDHVAQVCAQEWRPKLWLIGRNDGRALLEAKVTPL
jgi:hypothetical protein